MYNYFGIVCDCCGAILNSEIYLIDRNDEGIKHFCNENCRVTAGFNPSSMNILIAGSTPDGPYWLAFNLESLNLELPYHKNLFDAIQVCLKTPKNKQLGEGNGTFGEITVSYGQLMDEDCFVESLVKAQAQFADEESVEYNPAYKDITIQPPFEIDAVIELRTFY